MRIKFAGMLTAVVAGLLLTSPASAAPNASITSSSLSGPTSINEGGNANFTLSLGISVGTTCNRDDLRAGDTFTAQSGTVDSVPSSSQSIGFSGSVGQFSVSVPFSFQYLQDGTYTASVTDTLTVTNDPRGASGTYELPFSVSRTFFVMNLNPTFTAITFDPVLTSPLNVFNFSAAATDPGVLDTLTFDWDFDASDGVTYSDYTGSAGTLPSGYFGNGGEFDVNVRVTDGDGGVDFGMFHVTVIPEPSSVTIWSLLIGCTLAVGWYRRRRNA